MIDLVQVTISKSQTLLRDDPKPKTNKGFEKWIVRDRLADVAMGGVPGPRSRQCTSPS